MPTFFAPAPERGLLRLTGRDRVAFLHNMTTSHVKRLTPGEGQPAAIVDQRAQVLDWGAVYVDPAGSALWLASGPGRLADTAAWLDKYLITEDVVIADQADELALLFVTGDEAAGVVARVVGAEVAPWTMAETPELRVFGVTGFGGPGYLLAAAPQRLGDLVTALAAAGATPADAAQLDAARVAAGVPAFGAELGGRTNPWEARLDGAIALDKGCYLGQEVVARLQAYDKVQRLLIGLELETSATVAPGTPVFAAEPPADGAEARPIGEVTSVVPGAAGRPPALLALVKRAFAAPGTPLALRPADGAALAAIAADRPFWAAESP